MGGLKVTLVRSGVGRPKDQRAALLGLGLKKMRQTSHLKDTPAIRGMINKVNFLLSVEEVAEEPTLRRRRRPKASQSEE